MRIENLTKSRAWWQEVVEFLLLVRHSSKSPYLFHRHGRRLCNMAQGNGSSIPRRRIVLLTVIKQVEINDAKYYVQLRAEATFFILFS
jgi:hypothetical protein